MDSHPTVPPPEGTGGHFLYWAGHALFRLIFRLLWRREVHGLNHVPRTGPLLLAANHASYADPPLVGSSLARPLHFLAKEELFGVPLFGRLIRRVNAFPVRRKSGDVGAFRAAQNILAAGGALMVFPEGSRQRSGRLAPPKAGVGLLAIRSGAPVVPVYVRDTNRLLHFPRLHVFFGPPLRPRDSESAAHFSHRVMAAIRLLGGGGS